MASANSNQTPLLRIFAGGDPFGCDLKTTLVSHLRTLPNISVVDDLGTDSYYSIAASVGRKVFESPSDTLGLLVCGTGIGVGIFANKFPGVYAATCTSVADAVNSRSINSANVLCLSSKASENPSDAIQILSAFLSTPFKSPCPASDDKPWPTEISQFLDNSLPEMSKIGIQIDPSHPSDTPPCAICCLRKGMAFEPVGIMPGAEMKIVRQSPTSAVVKFKAGSLEPAHHHTFGHDVVVMKGRKKVWNMTKKESYELNVGDYLFTPGGDLHRVKYFEDTEFFIRWDGDWDIFLDEDLDAAASAIDQEFETAKEDKLLEDLL